MILLLAGTSEGREVYSFCREKGYPVLAAVTSAYGKRLLCRAVNPQGDGESNWAKGEVVCRTLGWREMAHLILERGIIAVVDATHPYANLASENACRACTETPAVYIRYEREASTLPESPLVHFCADYNRAAETAASLGETIFLTTGTKTLNVFVAEARKRGKRVVARVLPTPESVASCLAAGLGPQDVVAVWGPLGYGVNRELFRHFGASVVVTKESGPAGGTEEKVRAALDLGIPVVVVARPLDPERGKRGCVVRSLGELALVLNNLGIGRKGS